MLNGTVNVAERLRVLRASKRYSQSEVANSTGMSLSSYQSYENGKREPKSDSLVKLAKFYGVTISALLGLEEPSEKSSPPSGNLGREQLREIFEKLNNDELKKLLDYSRYLLWLRSQEDN